MADEGLTTEEQDLLLAANVSYHMDQGKAPATVPATFRLYPGEVLFGSPRCILYAYTGAEVVAPGSAWVAFGSPLMMAGTLAASAMFNRSQRIQAERAAMAQWRPQNGGLLHVTSQRLALQGEAGWQDFPYEHFHTVELTDLGLIGYFADWPMLRFDCSSPIWTYVLLQRYGFGVGVDVPIPDELRARAIVAAGRPTLDQ